MLLSINIGKNRGREGLERNKGINGRHRFGSEGRQLKP
jgi:hypothetical protein